MWKCYFFFPENVLFLFLLFRRMARLVLLFKVV